mmetsp:Transcript_2895/g.10496  ORF Transcript_2895/g.10496 Transcript_2895/m.10496 type:complete len:112 (-) Transcript_2895:135-470(-)|eukprot:scaffold784_cov399-Prasinococcus_capsulatus_cf.AAC.7
MALLSRLRDLCPDRTSGGVRSSTTAWSSSDPGLSLAVSHDPEVLLQVPAQLPLLPTPRLTQVAEFRGQGNKETELIDIDQGEWRSKPFRCQGTRREVVRGDARSTSGWRCG